MAVEFESKSDHGTSESQPPWLWVILLIVAGVPRLLLAFLLPNPDGDAYSYLYTIHAWRESLVAGTFEIKTLRDFWLPLYQFLSALISVVINHPVYVSKLVSAVCGIGVCALVFLIAWRLTSNRVVSLVAALLVSLSPLHLLYSAFSMTEIPHSLFVLGCLYAALTRRWFVASLCAALAGFTRVESWMLIILLPAYEFFVRRRIPWRTFGVLLIAPLAWFYICWAATGDYLFYFHERALYIRDHLASMPGFQYLSPDHIRWNASKLIHSVNPVVLLGCLVGAGLWYGSKNRLAVAAVAVCFFAYLGFLVAAFLSGNQPEIWGRYGLLSFATGMPLAAWAYTQITRGRAPRVSVVLAAAILVVCTSEVMGQIKDARETIKQTAAQQIIANSLNRYFQKEAGIFVLCDDPVLPTMTSIPPDHFVTSSMLTANPADLPAEIERRGIDYIVYQRDDVRSLADSFPGLRRGIPIEKFELDFPRVTTDWDGSAYLYKLKAP